MILGFNVGSRGILSLQERIAIYKSLRCKAIEIGLINTNEKERWDAIKELTVDDLEPFEHISLHAPALDFVYDDNDATKYVLEEIQKLYERFHFKHAIPDKSLPIIIESNCPTADDIRVEYEYIKENL